MREEQGSRSSQSEQGAEEGCSLRLQYFGKRYLNPYLSRWISADPLAVHAPGEADLNLYAYVSGHVLKSVDPLGLQGQSPNTTAQQKATQQFDAALSGGDYDVAARELNGMSMGGMLQTLDGLAQGQRRDVMLAAQNAGVNVPRMSWANDVVETLMLPVGDASGFMDEKQLQSSAEFIGEKLAPLTRFNGYKGADTAGHIATIAIAARDAGVTQRQVFAYAIAPFDHESYAGGQMVESLRFAQTMNYSGGPAYRGRGYMHLTQDYNYARFGLTNNPSRAADPTVSAGHLIEALNSRSATGAATVPELLGQQNFGSTLQMYDKARNAINRDRFKSVPGSPDRLGILVGRTAVRVEGKLEDARSVE